MGERFLLDALAWEVRYENALARLRVMEEDEDDFREVYTNVMQRMRPVYYLGKERVVANDGHGITLGNEVFKSRVVSVNLAHCEFVYPFVGTSGRAAYEYALSLEDDLFRYWADAVCEMALRSAGASFKTYMQELLGTKNIYSVNPGSVIDWPMSEQVPLFRLLGDVYEHTGILLEKSFLMRPVKSGSGIMYVSEKRYENCMLCPMADCPNRRAKFDAEMFKREYGE